MKEKRRGRLKFWGFEYPVVSMVDSRIYRMNLVAQVTHKQEACSQ